MGDNTVAQVEGSGFGDNWRFYMDFSNAPVSIIYDATVGQLSEEDKKQYPSTLVLKIPFLDESENYYVSTPEKERIYKIAEGLNYGHYRARMIGIVVGPGCGYIVLCCAIWKIQVKKMVHTLMRNSGCSSYSYNFDQHDHFAYYNQVLVRPLLENNFLRNRTLWDRLVENGEAFKKLRDIDFSCRFPDPQHIQCITDQLAKQGFNVMEHEKEENNEYSLHFSVEKIPDLIWIHTITCKIISMLQDSNGYLEGWGCRVIKDDES